MGTNYAFEPGEYNRPGATGVRRDWMILAIAIDEAARKAGHNLANAGGIKGGFEQRIMESFDDSLGYDITTTVKEQR